MGEDGNERRRVGGKGWRIGRRIGRQVEREGRKEGWIGRRRRS